MYPEYLPDQGVKPWILNMDREFRGVKFGDISEFISCIKYQKLPLPQFGWKTAQPNEEPLAHLLKSNTTHIGLIIKIEFSNELINKVSSLVQDEVLWRRFVDRSFLSI